MLVCKFCGLPKSTHYCPKAHRVILKTNSDDWAIPVMTCQGLEVFDAVGPNYELSDDWPEFDPGKVEIPASEDIGQFKQEVKEESQKEVAKIPNGWPELDPVIVEALMRDAPGG